MLNLTKNTFNFEKKLVFLINFLLIILVILIFYYDISMSYFFYFNIFITFILSYIFFKRSKKLSKTLIITNMFIFFYFLYPKVSEFLYYLLGSQSYLFILFYNVTIAYIFLYFSDNHKNFYGDLSKFSFKVLLIIILLGLVFGLLFFWVKEPVPTFFEVAYQKGFLNALWFLLGTSFVVAFSEQIIFSGFLFNVYKNLTSKKDAYFQVSLIFVSFHLLRFKILIDTYYNNFPNSYLFYLTFYYILLFLFMIVALYLYSFKKTINGKVYEGNIFYAILLHLVTDFSLFFYYFLNAL